MSARLNDLFQIRPHEGRMVALLMALMFFPAAGAAIGLPSVEGLFLARFGAKFLPYIYIAQGLATAVTTLSITTLLGRISRTRFYLLLPLALGLLLAGARIPVALDLGWSYPVLLVGANLWVSLQGILTWGLAGLVCDTRQAKRLFPLFGAGAILGTALGGLVTRALVPLLGTENLILVWVVALGMTFGLVRVLTYGLAEPPRSRRRRQRAIDDLQSGYQYVRRAPFMRWIATSAVLFTMIFFSLNFPFSKAVAGEFSDEDAMTSFLGLFQGVSTSVAFLISLFVANRLYARLGFVGGILILPVIFLGGFSVLTVWAVFPVFVIFRFLHEAWLAGITRTAWNATFNVVPPERRDQARLFVNGVPLQLGVVLTGILLVFGQQTLSPQQLYVIGIIAAALTVFAVWRARRAYTDALVRALQAGRPHVFFSEVEPFGGVQQDAAAVAVAVTGLADSEPPVRRVSAEILGNLAAPEVTRALVDALDDPDAQVRGAALRSLARSGTASALLDVTACLNDPEPLVRAQAIRALHALAGNSKGLVTQIGPRLADGDPSVRAAAAVALLHRGSFPEAFQVLETMARSDDAGTRVTALEAFADWGDATAYESAATGLADARPAVRRAAAYALSKIDAEACVSSLVQAFGDADSSVREAVAVAVGTIGEPALQPTVKALSDPRLEAGALRALHELPVQGEAEAIRGYARKRIASALQYHSLWRSVQSTGHDDDRVQLLAESLLNTSRRHGANALRAIGLFSDRASVALAIENLSSPDAGQRANAVEILDSMTDHDTIRPVLQLWEAPQETSGTDGRADGPTAGDGWLLQVLQDAGPWLRACAALVAAGTKTHEIRAVLEAQMQTDPDPLVREAAAAALNGDPTVETPPAISMMERILFLRRVPLFSNLSPEELKGVAGIADELLFVDGDKLSEQGEPGDRMYIIVSGEVRVVARRDGGPEVRLACRKTGDYVGEMAIISHEPRMASLVAAGDVRTLCITQHQFEAILRQRPETSLAVMRVLCQRLRDRETGIANT